MRLTKNATMRIAVLAVLALFLGPVLAACSASTDPDDVNWTLVAEGDIVAMDSTTGVYVEGYIGLFGGSVESRSVIDYKYARELKDGGFRQDLVSSTYDRIATSDYPGSNVVTIYQDAMAVVRAPASRYTAATSRRARRGPPPVSCQTVSPWTAPGTESRSTCPRAQ